MKRSIVLILTVFSVLQISAQRNEIFSARIASLQVVAGDDWLSPPVINLGAETPMNIAFDDLTHEYHRYTYRIQHCEADWTPSEGIFASDYIDGFAEGNTIDNSEESVNTNVLYTHYSLQIPNERCSIKMSGNYQVTVFDENNNDEKMFTACFMVVEPKASVSLNVSTNTDIDVNKSHQQVGLELNFGSLNVTDYANQIKTVVLQNGRWDNAIINSHPQYVMSDGLRWEHSRDLIFDAGNEYRKFEMLDVNHTTMGLESVHWDGKSYHAYVWKDEPRPSYVYDEDADGAFYIRNSDNQENDRVSDYLTVHFRLMSPYVGDIYLNGVWTNDRFLPAYQMKYDEVEQCYLGSVPLKQGYYSYQYLILGADGTTKPVPSEGSFYQTENKYQALVYFRGTGERTDRLVGYQQAQLK
jgi:hypothetical protein